jgi:hypothetical protein
MDEQDPRDDEVDAHLDAGLAEFFTGGRETRSHEPASILARIESAVGADLRVTLTDPEETGSTPILGSLAHVTREAIPGLPRQVGRFQLHGEIGRGGVGSVLKAHDVDLGRDVAV